MRSPIKYKKAILKEYKKDQQVLSKIVFCNLEGGYMNPAVLERHYFCATLKALNKENPQEVKIRLHNLRMLTQLTC